MKIKAHYNFVGSRWGFELNPHFVFRGLGRQNAVFPLEANALQSWLTTYRSKTTNDCGVL